MAINTIGNAILGTIGFGQGRQIAVDGTRTSSARFLFTSRVRGLYRRVALGLALLTGRMPVGLTVRPVMCEPSCWLKHRPHQRRWLPVVVNKDAGRVCVG